MRHKRLILTLSLVLLIFTGCTRAVERGFKFPEPKGYVNDLADIISPEWELKTEALCGLIEDRTSAEIVVVTVETFEPCSTSREYATSLGNAWGVGQKGLDNGIVILTAVRDREIFLACGKGYNLSFNPVLDSIYRNVIMPYFREANFDQGLYAGTQATGEVIARMQGKKLDGEGGLEPDTSGGKSE